MKSSTHISYIFVCIMETSVFHSKSWGLLVLKPTCLKNVRFETNRHKHRLFNFQQPAAGTLCCCNSLFLAWKRLHNKYFPYQAFTLNISYVFGSDRIRLYDDKKNIGVKSKSYLLLNTRFREKIYELFNYYQNTRQQAHSSLFNPL